MEGTLAQYEQGLAEHGRTPTQDEISGEHPGQGGYVGTRRKALGGTRPGTTRRGLASAGKSTPGIVILPGAFEALC